MTPPRREATNDAVRRIFGARAAFYRTSAAHTDPQVLARLVELASPRADMVALDVATGAGHTALALAPHVGRVIACDLTAPMLAQASELAGGLPLHLCQADVHHLPFAADAFDLVTCRRAAHHFADLALALDEMGRVLSAGGRLVVDDRSVPEIPEVDRLMNRLDLLHDPSHVRQAPPGEWVQLLEAAGFAVEACETYERLRPVRDLYPDEDPAAADEVDRVVQALPDDVAQAAGRQRVDGVWHIRHWYLMLAATRR
jgi:ubiquinone/menaquinone biosynthesis C-methylase UbiE